MSAPVDGAELLRMIQSAKGETITFTRAQGEAIARTLAGAQAMQTGQRRMDAAIEGLGG